jgi:protein PhnA
MSRLNALVARSGAVCELCQGGNDLAELAVSPDDLSEATAVWACETCRNQVEERSEVDAKHWFCLHDSIWSEHPPVQVTGFRMLKRLAGESWASDLLDQVYLPDDVREWAEQSDNQVVVVDSNGTRLADGDSVTLIKDLDVKGANFTAKRGTLVKNIRLGDDPGLVEGRVNGTGIYLKVEFLKKQG